MFMNEFVEICVYDRKGTRHFTINSSTSQQFMAQNKLVVWLEDVGIKDIASVGGKNASLGEMIKQLSAKAVRVPTGFATTAHAYRQFMKTTGLDVKLKELFSGLNIDNIKQLVTIGRKARDMIMAAPFPPEFQTEIEQAYRELCVR